MPNSCLACESTVNATKTLSGRGIRLTTLRRDVLQVLYHSKAPVGAYALYDTLNSKGKASAPPAVYRVLDFLVEQGLAHKLRSVSAYTACCIGPHAHHAAFLICRDCGKVEEIKGPSLSAISKHAFQIEDLIFEATGLCGSCQ